MLILFIPPSSIAKSKGCCLLWTLVLSLQYSGSCYLSLNCAFSNYEGCKLGQVTVIKPFISKTFCVVVVKIREIAQNSLEEGWPSKEYGALSESAEKFALLHQAQHLTNTVSI